MLYPESEYVTIFNDADKDRDGFIDYIDLVRLIKKVDMDFPEHVIKSVFKQSKIRIPPAEQMDLDEFLEIMGKLSAYRGGRLPSKGPILHSRLSSSIVHWLRTPRFARFLYEQFFYETDEDRDGFITFEEFLITLRRYDLEYLADTVRYEFRKYNTRGDGYMDLVEFMLAMGFGPLKDHKPIERPVKVTPVKAAPAPKKKKPKFQMGASLLRQIFKSMDTDGNGSLNKDELRQCFMQMGQEMDDSELEDMITANDKEGDGCLTYDEFVNSVYPTVREVEGSDDEE